MTKLSGITVNLNGTDYVVPPMTLRIQLEEPTSSDVELLQKGGASQVEFANAAVNVLWACAKRNYPDMDRDAWLDLDFGDLGNLVAAVMTKSGFAPRPLTPAAPEKTEDSGGSPSPSTATG